MTLLASLSEEFKPLKGMLLNDADHAKDALNFKKTENALSAKRSFHGHVSSSKSNINHHVKKRLGSGCYLEILDSNNQFQL